MPLHYFVDADAVSADFHAAAAALMMPLIPIFAATDMPFCRRYYDASRCADFAGAAADIRCFR